MEAAHVKSTATAAFTFTTGALDYELARRRRFPPASLHLFPELVGEEWISVAALRAELAATPFDHPDYSWREWELALAERQATRQGPHTLFYRIVERRS